MLDFLLMPRVKFPVVDRVQPQSNEFAAGVENRTQNSLVPCEEVSQNISLRKKRSQCWCDVPSFTLSQTMSLELLPLRRLPIMMNQILCCDWLLKQVNIFYPLGITRGLPARLLYSGLASDSIRKRSSLFICFLEGLPFATPVFFFPLSSLL